MDKTATPMPAINNPGIKPISTLTPSVTLPPALPLGQPAASIGKGLASPQLKSAAWALGYFFNYRFPKDEAFKKVASALKTNEHAIRFIFAKQAMEPLKKAAMNPLHLGLAALALGTVGKPMARGGMDMLYNLSSGYGLTGPNMGYWGGLDPRSETDFHRMALREAFKNRQRMGNMQELNWAMTGYPMGSPMAGMHAPGMGY